MSDFAPLTRELDVLEAVQVKLAGIADRTDEDRRHDLIRLRRELALQIAEVGKAAEPIFGAADPSLARDYRNHFSRMRSATALHQANWPAVRLDVEMEPYQASALEVNEANRSFLAWVRGALDQLRSDH